MVRLVYVLVSCESLGKPFVHILCTKVNGKGEHR